MEPFYDAAEQQFKEKLIDEAVKPNADEIARIWSYRDVALVFYAIPPGDEPARRMGWTGERVQVKRLSEKQAAAHADALQRLAPGDPAIPWLRSRKEGRIFVVAGSGTLCVNFEAGKGYSFEAGTLDRQRVN